MQIFHRQWCHIVKAASGIEFLASSRYIVVGNKCKGAGIEGAAFFLQFDG